MFSSLCQMEAQKEAVPIDPNTGHWRRLLEDESFLHEEEREGLHHRFGKVRVITVRDKTQVSFRGRDYTEKLSSAVVIAYLYENFEHGEVDDKDSKPRVYAYAPVSFEKVFEEGFVNHPSFKMIYIILALVLTVLLFMGILYLVWCCVTRRAKKKFVAEMKGPGLQMRIMPYDVCTNPKFNTSTLDTMTEVSGR